MSNGADNEKAKETKTSSSSNSYEDYEDEEVENAEEGLQIEEVSVSESSLPPDTRTADRGVSLSQSELLEEQSVISEEEKRRQILRDKYLNAVGRRPKAVLNIAVVPEESEKRRLFFGERKPAALMIQRREKWQDAIKKAKPIKYSPGKVLCDVRLPAFNDGLICVRFEPNGNSLATSYRNGEIEVRNPSNAEVILSLKTIEARDNLPIRGLRYHPTDVTKLYAGGAIGSVQVFDTESGELLGYSNSVSQINNLDISVDGSNLVTVGRGPKIGVIDPYTLKVKLIIDRPELNENTPANIDELYHKLRIYGLRCHPENANEYLTGGWDNSVKIWDFRVNGAVRSIDGPWINGDALDVFGNKILTASWRAENSIQIWDYTTGKLMNNVPVAPKTTHFEGEFLYTAKFFRSFRTQSLIAVGGSGFDEVSVLNTDTQKMIAYFPSHKVILSLDTLGRLVAYGGKESLFRLGKLTE